MPLRLRLIVRLALGGVLLKILRQVLKFGRAPSTYRR
jgi:hypothetical protein